MATRSQWIVAVAGAVALAGAAFLGAALTPGARTSSVGSRAPGFSAVRVSTGDTVTLADYAGRVVLLNIWATWCGPCEAEMPSLQRLHQALGPYGLTIVAVSVDVGSAAAVRQWVEERGLTFDVLQDRRGRIQQAFGTVAVPESFVIDREGVIVKRVIGALEWDHPTQQALLRHLLGLPDADLAAQRAP